MAWQHLSFINCVGMLSVNLHNTLGNGWNYNLLKKSNFSQTNTIYILTHKCKVNDHFFAQINYKHVAQYKVRTTTLKAYYFSGSNIISFVSLWPFFFFVFCQRLLNLCYLFKSIPSMFQLSLSKYRLQRNIIIVSQCKSSNCGQHFKNK